MKTRFFQSTLGALALFGQAQAGAQTTAAFSPPVESNIPDGPQGMAIREGKKLLTETKQLLPKNVGNGLTAPTAISMVVPRRGHRPGSAYGACFRSTVRAAASSIRCRSVSTTVLSGP